MPRLPLLLCLCLTIAEAAEPLPPRLELQPGDLPAQPAQAHVGTPCDAARDRLAKAEQDLVDNAPKGLTVGKQREMRKHRDQALDEVRRRCD